MTDRTSARRDHREPLWDRIDANRVKTAAFISVFVLGTALSAGLMVGVGGLVLGFVLIRGGGDQFFAVLPYLSLFALAMGGVLAVAHVVRMLTHPEVRLPGRFGAVPIQIGTLPATESALEDMSLAAGRSTPRLWLIDDCDRVNAFALGTGEDRAMIGITRGFSDRLSAADQRAVFANLMVRVRDGDTTSATVLSAIMGPIWGQRELELRRDQGRLPEERTLGEALTGAVAVGGGRADPEVVLGGFLLGALGVVLTEILMTGHERAARVAAEKADAEGMLLLKDPEEMLTALTDVLEADNTVPGAGEAYSSLFFCWAGFGYAPEDDPEMERIGRLREVLGAAGAPSA